MNQVVLKSAEWSEYKSGLGFQVHAKGILKRVGCPAKHNEVFHFSLPKSVVRIENGRMRVPVWLLDLKLKEIRNRFASELERLEFYIEKQS